MGIAESWEQPPSDQEKACHSEGADPGQVGSRRHGSNVDPTRAWPCEGDRPQHRARASSDRPLDESSTEPWLSGASHVSCRSRKEQDWGTADALS